MSVADFFYGRLGGLGFTNLTGGLPTFNGFALDQTTDQLEWITHAPGGGSITITRLGVRLNSTSGATPTYKFSLQGVTGAGVPDGTIKGGASPASRTFNPDLLGWTASTWNWVTLDNSYATTSGEQLAIVIAYDSGTIDGSNFATFANTLSNAPTTHHPYVINNNAGTRARQTLMPIYGFATSSRAYGRPLQSVTNQAFNQTSTPDEYAIAFTPTAGWGNTFLVGGVRLERCAVIAATTLNARLYDGTTAIQSIAQDADMDAAASSQAAREWLFPESSLTALSFGSTYRVGIATASNTNMAVTNLGVAAAADWDAWPYGQTFFMSTRTDAGAWTDDATRRIWGELLLADWTEPAGGGAGGFVFGG